MWEAESAPVAGSDATVVPEDKPLAGTLLEPQIQSSQGEEGIAPAPEHEQASEQADAWASALEAVLESYPLHPAAVRLWGWSHALAISTLLVPLLIVGGLVQGPRALLAIALLGLLIWSIASRHLRLSVARFRCERFARGLRYRHGVWWQSEVFIPSARVQHTEVNQGPLARRYGIGKLKVFTAAVQLGALEIDGLAYADAVLLRDRLLGRESEPLSAAAVSAGFAGTDCVGADNG
ncbi:MAG: PH domain-containing protein [Lysobacterales bacterium]